MYRTRLLIGDLRKEDSSNRIDEKYRATITKYILTTFQNQGSFNGCSSHLRRNGMGLSLFIVIVTPLIL